MLQLVVALSAICGIVGCAAGLEESKRTDSKIFPFWQAAPSQACWTPVSGMTASPNPSVTTTLLKQLLCVGRQLKQQATILLSLLSTTLCICTATAEEGSVMHLFFGRMHREPALSGAYWLETIYSQRLACSIDTGWRQTNVGIPFHSTCAFHLALLDSMICCNWSWPYLPSVV